MLIVGGAADASLCRLALRAASTGVAVRTLLVHPDTTPRVRWDLDTNTLSLDGEPLVVSGVFLRNDVFYGELDARPEAGYRSEAWHDTLAAWARAHPALRLCNRGARWWSKPETLLLARELGLLVPETVITNDLEVLRTWAARGAVAKPVGGGGHCHPLEALLAKTPTREGATAAPAIVQTRMTGREVRVFAVGDARFAFVLHSALLDYRLDPEVRIEALDEVPAEIAGRFDQLLAAMALDFAAADFKAGADGRLRLLEVNNQPMFAAFDEAAGGRLADALLAWLSGVTQGHSAWPCDLPVPP